MTELLAARIAQQADRHPDATAVVTAHERANYAEFWTKVTRTAAGLSGMRRVAVLPTSDIDSLIAVSAAMSAGVSVVLLHRHLLPRQLSRTLAVTRADAVVAVPRQHRRLRRLGYQGPIRTVGELETDVTAATARAESELLVGITSGSTGEPKLFVRNQRSWAATLDRSDATFDIGAGDRVSTPGVLDHTHFLYGALHALTRGATVDLRAVGDALPDGTTHLYSVPAIAWDIVRSGIGPISGVREVLSSAARWPRPARAALRQVLPNASLVHFYGASELSFVSFDRGLGAGDEDAAGELFDGVEVRIRDGFVVVRSDMLFDGYLTDAGLTGGPEDGWMSVGDRGLLDGNRLSLFGRGTDTLIRGGLNVELVAIEKALTAIPGITEAACLGLPDARMGEVPAAAVVMDRHAPDIDEIWRHLRASLPSPSIPVLVLPVPALPRTARGKLDRQALREVLTARRAAP
ncbi:o-succinylbenzoate--CoA ligase [Nocardia donostiensis]|uniref:AMP-binding protein n=1 Tax=Nocardia donostiensis TaxID=1538463 RepID=UPI0009DA9DEB|nr:AMP-binding protein [Nocardia donostiensis]OQS14915.1 o-succinylbenzoate--CoA ligase [Nocardia donostiensis]